MSNVTYKRYKLCMKYCFEDTPWEWWIFAIVEAASLQRWVSSCLVNIVVSTCGHVCIRPTPDRDQMKSEKWHSLWSVLDTNIMKLQDGLLSACSFIVSRRTVTCCSLPWSVLDPDCCRPRFSDCPPLLQNPHRCRGGTSIVIWVPMWISLVVGTVCCQESSRFRSLYLRLASG